MLTVVALALENFQPIQAAQYAVNSNDGSIEPYLSLAVLDDANEADIKEAVANYSSVSRGIEITVSGFGVFPTKNPVTYASVLPSDALLSLHRSLYEFLGEEIKHARPHYTPSNWMPHITIKIGDQKNDPVADLTTLMKQPVPGVYNSSEVLIVMSPLMAIQVRHRLL